MVVVFHDPLRFPSIQQNLIAARSAFPDACDIDRWTVLHGEGVLARAASHAARWIEIRLLHLLHIPCRIDHFRGTQVNSLGRGRTPLLTHDAVCGHGPGQATAAIVKGRSQPHWPGATGDVDRPSFFFGCDLPDCARWTNLRAQDATGFAITEAGY